VTKPVKNLVKERRIKGESKKISKIRKISKRNFFMTPLNFANGPKISKSADFDSQ